MKRKTLIITAISGGIILLGTAGFVAAQNSGNNPLKSWGSYLAKSFHSNQKDSNYELYSKDNGRKISASLKEEDIFEIGNDIVIKNSELEQAIDFFKLAGNTEDKARELAITQVEQRNALYAEAIKQGYTVTEEEINDYLDELKETLETSDNNESYQSVLEGFGSEEEYWEYEFTVYQINLPIQNYVSDMEKSNAETNNLNAGSQEANESWEAQFEKLKQELCEKQEFTAP